MEDVVSACGPNAATWRGRRVFVTGHTGFKGGWLSLWLAHLGAKVRGYSLDPASGPGFFSLAGLAGILEDVRGDLRDRAHLDEAIRAFQPEVVLHLAAQPLVRRSYVDPVETYSINVLGTAHLLESLRTLSSVAAAIVVTTDKCYQNREWPWSYRETDTLGGHDPYSSSKACVEMLAASYRASFWSNPGLEARSVALATARAGNVIGGGDWAEDRLIPDLVRSFLEHRPALIRNPAAIRPWQHVLEPLAGYLLLAEALLQASEPDRFTQAWNFGPPEEDAWPVARVATRMATRWCGADWVQDPRTTVHEAAALKLDASKARGELGWRPRLELVTALDWTTDWYRAWHAGRAMQSYSLAQIADYERLAIVEPPRRLADSSPATEQAHSPAARTQALMTGQPPRGHPVLPRSAAREIHPPG